MAVATPSNITAGLVRQYWDLRLEKESLFRDIFSALRTRFDRTTNIDIPMNTLTLQIDAEVNNGYRNATIGFVNALNGVRRYGSNQLQIGFEETLREKSQDIYFNEMSHAAAYFNYGINYHDQKPYGLDMNLVTQLLGNHAEEGFGLDYRTALLQRRSVNLTFAPVNQAQAWNPRWYIKNAATQPAYSTVLQTHTNNIAQAFINAGTGVNATLDADYLNGLRHYCITNRIEMLDIPGGGKGWILTVPTNQVYHVHNFSRDDSLIGYWTAANQMNDMTKANLPLLLGRYLDIYLVEDDRAPTITVGGTASPFTLTPGYVLPGNVDQRDTSADARDVGFLLGRAPLIDWYPSKLHHKYDDYNYQKWEGKGYFCMRGINLRMYDDATPTNTSWEQRYSVVCAWARDTIRS